MVLAAGIVTFILLKIIPKFRTSSASWRGTARPDNVAHPRLEILIHHTIWVILGIVAVVIIYKKINGTRGANTSSTA
jgi:type II secretory pathway component PulF